MCSTEGESITCLSCNVSAFALTPGGFRKVAFALSYGNKFHLNGQDFPVLFGLSGWTTHRYGPLCWVLPASPRIIRLGASLRVSMWMTDQLRQTQFIGGVRTNLDVDSCLSS